MSNQRQNHKMTFVKRKWCRRRRCSDVSAIILAVIAIWTTATTTTTNVACAKLETQIKLLINDEALLLEQSKQQQQQQPPPPPPAHSSSHAENAEPHHSHHMEAAAASAPRNAEEQQHYEMYRSSDLRRLSYETIHRILRDENEPMYRREDAEMRYYQKRSYQPTHEVFRRAADEAVEPPVHLLNFTRANLSDLSLIRNVNVKAVREFDVSFNRLVAVNLTRFAQLQHADLSNNLLTALPLAEGPLQVEVLNLNGNSISGGTPTAAYQHLRELHLSSNRIVNLASLNLSALSALEILDLSCNRIENLETAFFPQRMHNLKYLNLAGNRLSSIYRETFYNLLSLNTLILRHNNITDIDYETFLALPNLQFLDLSHNRLRGESIRALQGIPDLVGLSIAYNTELGAFMQEFVASWSLKELDASGTGLCQIPAALAQSVRTLKLTDNWLKIINCGDLDSYPLLQHLDLSQSRIEDIEDDALGRLEILEVLFLDHNTLRKVPMSLPTSLQHLFLQHNDIMDIQLVAFQGLNQLQTLDLSGNKLLYLPALPLPKLLTLNVQSSELRGINQAIVNTLPRLRDMLLEDNPIKCSDLLGIAEWASPCRILDHTTNNANSEVVAALRAEIIEEKIDEAESGQLPAKIDLKQQFVLMHNFFEKFRSSSLCGQQMKEVAEASTPPPICAIEMNAETEPTVMQEIQFITESNLPTEPETQPRDNNNEKLYDNHSANFAKTLQRNAQNNERATTTVTTTTTPTPTQKTIKRRPETKVAATIAKTSSRSGSTASTTPQKDDVVGGSGSSIKVLTADATDKSFAAAAVTSKIIFTTTEENFKKLLTTTISTTAAAPATVAANQDELHRATTIINAKEVASMTTAASATETTKATEAVINSSTQTTTAEIPSTSTLKHGNVAAKRENFDTKTTETTKITTTASAAMEKSLNEAATVTIHVLPQTIPATIKSDNSLDQTTIRSLLSQQGLKTSAAGVRADVVARVDKAKNDSKFIENSNGNNSKMLLPQSLSSKRQQLNFNGISGQQHIGALPTTKKTILANQQQQQQQHASNITAHRHEPLQLHIKNRHLIGTPLLMHKGHNILVETEQLMLPTLATAAATKLSSTTTAAVAAAIKAETVGIPVTSTTPKPLDDTASPESKADKLASSQTLAESKEPLHFLAAQQKTEAILAESNEQNENAVKFAAAVSDMRTLPATTEIINRKTTAKAVADDTSTAVSTATADDVAANNKIEPITKLPKARAEKKKKLSLTMKKMTITKHAGGASPAQTQSLPTTKHHHQSLNTPRENEAVLTGGNGREGDLMDWQTLKETKEEQNFIEPKPQLYKHSAVNTPTHAAVQHHELPQLSAVEQQQLTPQNSLSKSEQWLDVRKSTSSTGHPGLVILLSLVALIVLLLGLIQVYRCDRPWRQQLAHQQRPHQLEQQQFSDFTGDDGSFLNYQQQRQANPTQQKWHHSTRLLPPRCSPLHNLHVRELQSISAVDHQRKQNFCQTLNVASNSGSSCCSSNTSNTNYSSTGAIMEDDAFYIEMTPDSGQPSHQLESDLLPMELLSATTKRMQHQNFMDATELDDATNEQPTLAATMVPTELPTFCGESTSSATKSNNMTTSNKRLPVVKLAPTTRKFGLW